MEPTNDGAHVRGGAPSKSDQPIRFAGSVLGAQRHVCAFFNNADEAYGILVPFIREGLDRGEHAFHIVDPALRVAHLERLTESGIDAAGALRSGQLEVRAWEEAYLRGQRFDQSAMLALVEKVLDDGKTRGFPLTRLIAQMEWALEDRPGVDDLVEYETRLNYVLPRYRDPVI